LHPEEAAVIFRWSHYDDATDDETDWELDYSVSPAERQTRDYPGCAPEVEICAARSEDEEIEGEHAFCERLGLGSADLERLHAAILAQYHRDVEEDYLSAMDEAADMEFRAAREEGRRTRPMRRAWR